ncbi:MAG: ABC transporter permease [Clostridiales bacterium]|nr:ABC transporter permease [Clostridiales bacterium]
MTKFKQRLADLLPLAGLLVVFVLFSVLGGAKFYSSRNLMLIVNQAFTVMVVGIGVTMIFAHGGIDFSVGAVLALSEMFAAMVYKRVGAPVVLIIMSVLVAVLCGLITGTLTVKLRIPPFISSLCMQFACRGVVNTVLHANQIGVTELSAPGWGVKLPVLIGLAVVVFFILDYTKIGKYNKAIGENIRAARSSGINVDKYRIAAYLISGVTVGIAAYFDLLRNGVMSTNVGYGLEMNVITAVVLGGLSLSGGYTTSIRSAILGSLLIIIMTNGLTVVGVPISYIGIIQGIIFLLVILSTYRRDSHTTLLPR